MERPTYLVELDDGSTTTVEVTHGDRLRAELEAPKHGLPVSPGVAPLHTTTLWVWAAMTRMELTADPFQVFRSRVQALEVPKAGHVEADPTQQGQPTG